MKRYRIKKVITGDGTVWYCPQKKVLWFWWNMGMGTRGPYGNEVWANAVIRIDFEDSQKAKVEYLEPTSQTVPPEPNPPPKVL